MEQLPNQNVDTFEKSNSFARKSVYVLFISLGLLILSSFWIYSYQNSFSEAELMIEKEKIVALIDRANALEFSLYAAVPNISDTIKLNKLYIPEGQKKKEIIRISSQNKAKGNILDTEYSTRNFNKQDIVFEKLTQNHAKVITIEAWSLQWLNASNNTKSDKYEEVNKYIYTLQRQNNTWLIDTKTAWFNK